MARANRKFTITSDSGTTVFNEGQEVPKDIAEKYPHLMVGYEGKKIPAHDPTLPEKPTKGVLEKMDEAKLKAWIKQYRPNDVPSTPMAKEALVELILSFQE